MALLRYLFNPSNLLSLARGPLAILFIINNVTFRSLLIILAMFTDGIDGFVARKCKSTTRLGTVLDPLMDKFFVLIVLLVFYYENRLHTWQMAAMMSRDLSIALFIVCLLIRNRWKNYKYTWEHYNYRSLIFGKATTAMQFLTIFFMSMGYSFPIALFYLFYLCGGLVLIELFLTLKTNLKKV